MAKNYKVEKLIDNEWYYEGTWVTPELLGYSMFTLGKNASAYEGIRITPEGKTTPKEIAEMIWKMDVSEQYELLLSLAEIDDQYKIERQVEFLGVFPQHEKVLWMVEKLHNSINGGKSDV